MGEPFFFDRNNYADLVRMEVLRVKITVVQHDIAIHMAIIQTIGTVSRSPQEVFQLPSMHSLSQERATDHVGGGSPPLMGRIANFYRNVVKLSQSVVQQSARNNWLEGSCGNCRKSRLSESRDHGTRARRRHSLDQSSRLEYVAAREKMEAGDSYCSLRI